MKNTRYTLCLAALSPYQIEQAKAGLGPRKQITHVLMCGKFGKIFGTEKQCRKYFVPWSTHFPELFDSAVVAETCELEDYVEKRDLVLTLIDESERRKKRANTLLESSYDDAVTLPSNNEGGILKKTLNLFGFNR